MTIESVILALKECPWGLKLLVSGYLNTNLYQPEVDWREEEIAVSLTAAGLEDTSAHFFLRRHPVFEYRRKWRMVCLGMEVWSRTEYILGTYRCIFRNAAVWDPEHNSYHYIVLVCLCIAPQR